MECRTLAQTLEGEVHSNNLQKLNKKPWFWREGCVRLGAVPVCFPLLCLTLLLAVITPGRAQTTSVSGEVTDRSNATISGAVVSLNDAATRQISITETNGVGRFFFSSVTPGTY